MTGRITYRATAKRVEGDGFSGYAVTIHGLPENLCGVTQGRDWDEARSMTRECIALLLDVDEDSFDVSLVEE
jgi:hypothetical protein